MADRAGSNDSAATPPSPAPPDLLLVAHGTASEAGTRTTHRLRDAVAAVRPEVSVRLCFLDVGNPSLTDALADTDRSTVLVPLLLSTGFHVQTDIPAAVAGHRHVVVARHLGPHELLTDVLVDRLGEGLADSREADAQTVLAASGSRRPEAATELAEAAELLATRIGAAVRVVTVGEPLADRFAAMAGAERRPLHVATYLLTEGRFVDAVAAAASGLGAVSPPLGVHPALVSLVWLRYGDAALALRG
jgi:sirohydrochlorin ferrochelatase